MNETEKKILGKYAFWKPRINEQSKQTLRNKKNINISNRYISYGLSGGSCNGGGRDNIGCSAGGCSAGGGGAGCSP